MTSPINDDFPIDDSDDLLQDCFGDSSLASLMRIDSKETSLMVNLDAVRLSMLQSLSASPYVCLKDRTLLDSLPLASKLLIESIKNTENSLPCNFSTQDVGAKLSLWTNTLEPFKEFLKHVKDLGTVPVLSIQGLLDFIPEIVQTVFIHCKRSETFYGPKFDDLLPQLTDLFRRAAGLLETFFAILNDNVDFGTEAKREKKSLQTVLDKIGDIAVLTNGMDLKTQINTWKSFARLAVTHGVILKKFASTSCITRRYVDVVKDIETLLLDSLKDNKETNYERGIKCAAMLLKILVRLCTLYRGYCGNKVFIVLVELLGKLHRYLPPFNSERFIHRHSKNAECLATHVAPTIGELLNAIVDENEFREAFFEYGKSEIKDRIYYHLLTLKIMEELSKREGETLSLWMRENSNIFDAALANANYCCEDFLIDALRIPIRSSVGSGESRYSGIYDTTLALLCQSIARTSAGNFPTIEIVLLKHLLSGEFWSCLLTCDSWTYLARIASSELCAEHLSFLIKVQKSLITRENSLEFGILSHLIGRLYKLLSVDKSSAGDETKFTLFREIEDYTNRRLVDPFREFLPPKARQYLWQRIDTTGNLTTIFQELRRSPSVKNWTRLTSLLRSVATVGISKDERLCAVTLRIIWSFVAVSIPRSTGMTREMLLELIALLLDCRQPDCDKSSNNDWLMASIYKNMAETTEHVPTQHRIRMNIFIRENLKSFADQCGKQSLSSITELFCCLVSDENPWVRQESFETYAEHILKGPSSELFDNLSIGMSRLPRINRQITSYFSNTQIHAFAHYSSLDNYLRDFAVSSRDRSTWHVCYEPDFRTRDAKIPKCESENLDKRIGDICDELESLVERKNELSSDTADRLRLVLIKLLEV